MKVTIVGAGNVGATCADVISYRGIARSSIVRY
jgi:malate dehydrogenase